MNLRNIFKRRNQQHPNNNESGTSPKTAGERAFAAYTKPLNADEYSIQLEDDQTFQLNTAALFPSPSAVLKNFRGDGLPQWASIDTDTGIISGTVARDASVFGRSKVMVTANDKHQNEIAIKLFLLPRNLAAIADMTVHDCEVEENALFDMSLESLFYDPFSQVEPIIVCVSGLPRGLHFSPQSNSILGEVLDQTANRAPYVVIAWARGTRCRLSRQHFLLKVTVPHEEQAENNVRCPDRQSEIRTERQAILRESLVSQKPDNGSDPLDTDSVWEGGEIKGAWGIKMPTDTELDSSNALMSQTSEIDWTDTVIDLKQKQKRDGLSKDDRLNRISIDAMRRQNKLYLEFQSSLDAVRDGQVKKASIRSEGGTPLPQWMKVVREGFVVANLPTDVHSVDLELSVEFGNGHRLIKPVRIDF